jgi:dTDP-4-dehydrorhamnose reductase
METPIVVLGASGWIGHYLVPAIKRLSPHAHVTAVYRSRKPSFHMDDNSGDSTGIRGVEMIQSDDDALTLEKLPPATVIGLIRGEEESDFELQQRIIAIQNKNHSRYVYASSFNAVDADLSRAHLESDLGHAQSDYGKFKARCEREILETCKQSVIFRFGATHGWAPNREARTQDFLSKLARGETVEVKRGILQNRSFVGDLAEQIARLADSPKAEGVFHLGTSDFSDEIDFLLGLAEAFGYDKAQVTEGESTACNAVMHMERLPALLSNYTLPTESETMAKVSAQAELRKFVKPASMPS